MKLILLISTLLFWNFGTIAQVDNADSLLAILESLPDKKAQVEFCIEQGDVYMDTNIESFNYWYTLGVQIGENTSDEYLLTKLYAYWSYEYSARGDYEKQAELIHTGQTYLTDDIPFTYRRSLLSAEASYYSNLEQFENAIKTNLQLISQSKKQNDSSSWSGSLHNLGTNYFKKGEFLKADSLIKEAYTINQLIDNEQYQLINLSMLANIEAELGNSDKALIYELEVQKKYISMEYTYGIAYMYSNISGTYSELGDQKRAYQYIDSSMAVSNEHEFNSLIWHNYLLLSIYNEEGNNYKNALKYYKLYEETKTNSINEETAIRLASLTSELNESKLEVLEQNEAFQNEHINLQNEKIKSQNSENEKSKIQRYFLIGGLLAITLFGFFIYNRLKITRKQNKIIEEQKQEVESAYEEIAEKNSDITASITYAMRIQNAILPTPEVLKESLKEHFVLFKPKDLVSGDFYWTQTLNDHTFIAAADCTGHGVPGALVSVICHNALDRAVKEFNLIDPADILNKTREIVIEQFAKSHENVNDGMDIALCAIQNSTKKLKFAGANNPLWILRNNEIIATKGDKQPIGNYENLKPFVSHEIQTEENDLFYIFSDGYVDQFGGEKGKKFKSKAFAKLITSMTTIAIHDQGNELDAAFENWKSGFDQLDDVCVIGFAV